MPFSVMSYIPQLKVMADLYRKHCYKFAASCVVLTIAIICNVPQFCLSREAFRSQMYLKHHYVKCVTTPIRPSQFHECKVVV